MGRLKVHPDLGGSHALATLVNSAFETLRDPQKRAEYDLRLIIRKGRHSLPIGSRKFQMKGRADPMNPQWPDHGRQEEVRVPVSISARQDRRHGLRVQKKGMLRYASKRSEDLYQGELIDLSLAGLRFISREQIAPLTTIRIESPDWSGSASIRHCFETTSKNQRSYLNGAHFLKVKFHRSRGTFLSLRA